MKSQSLYQLLSEAAAGGSLPAGFSLHEKNDGVCWADGAQDGVQLYHMAPQEITAEQEALLCSAIDSAGAGRDAEAEARLLAFAREARALTAADLIQDYILDNKEKFNPALLHRFALRLAAESEDAECVKIGLTVLELFRANEEVKKVVRVLALSDEFTFFALFTMQRWENGNREIFETAQKVHGWGRIHAVDCLEPETEEIRRWLLREGIRNDVLPAYSALTCWEKSGARQLVRGESLQREDFCAIRDIIGALLDESAVSGLSAMDDGEACVLQFLAHAARQPLTADDMNVIDALRDHYAGEGNGAGGIMERCETLRKQLNNE